MRAFSVLGKSCKQRISPLQRSRLYCAFTYQDIFENAIPDTTPYKKIMDSGIEKTEVFGHKSISVAPEALTKLSEEAFIDIAHLLRPAHLQQLSNILKDPEASENDRFVALELLKNANIAAGMVLPGCQDTGTAIVMGKRGQYVFTDGKDSEHLSRGAFNAYTKKNLRYSQVAPMDMFTEVNTGSNLPVQVDIFASKGNEYHFQFIAKGGGSANKTFLYQQTKALLNPTKLEQFLESQIKTLGTAACPPYHLAVVIGGLSAEMTLKTVKLASTKYLDNLHTNGNKSGRAFRDLEWEDKLDS